MRVLHVTTEFPPVIYGGLGTAVGGLVNASARAGIQVAVLLVGHGSSPAYSTAAPDRPPEVGHAFSGAAAVLVHPVPHATAVADAVEFARWWRPDVVHVHVFWLAHVAIAIRKHTGVPLVYTVHSLDRAEYDLGQGPPECLAQWDIQTDLIGAADIVVALTDDESRLVAGYCPAVHGRIRIAGNGIDDSPGARAGVARRAAGDRVTVLFTGRFVERKGVGVLLDAASELLAAAPCARLVLAGGHRHAGGEAMAARWLPPECLRFRDRILFTGWLTPAELDHWYTASDILAVPSWYEPFGMVVLEGMLHGLAIVACDVGGPREILSHGRTGLLCAARDAAALRRELMRLIEDPALRLRLGRNAAREVRSRWLHRNTVERMRHVYGEAIARRAA